MEGGASVIVTPIIQTAIVAAVQSERQTGVPAELTFAQFVLESGSGKHMPGNNPFGIKAVAGQPCQVLSTVEHVNGKDVPCKQSFVVFPSLQAAFDAHGHLLSKGGPYVAAFQQYLKDRDLLRYVKSVSARYATDPGYFGKIGALIVTDWLARNIAAARGAL